MLSFSPKADPDRPLRCLMFDTWYNQFRGVVASIAVKDGCIRKGSVIILKCAIMTKDKTPFCKKFYIP